ncbi:MAG: hypothetical protein CVV53_06665 [Spirochaetae bacterium HGW-Spirochaetae-9]|nr:MAG: hypothetical protein CVV53_06665 [Spirochaetae bacterium HGW-Spirochaetae-9]
MKPAIELWSFGFKYGAIEANLVIDVRFLPNPYYVPALSHMTGKDGECAAYVFKDPDTRIFADALAGLVISMERSFGQQEKAILKVAIGCTGGRHRSVAVAEDLARALQARDLAPALRHKELEKSS